MAGIGTIAMDSNGFGYDSVPVVKISMPNIPILRAVATATLDSATTTISGIGVTVAGSHYIVTPQVTVSAPADSSNKQALVSSTITSNKVSSYIVNDAGKFYDSSGVVSVNVSVPTGDSNKQGTISSVITSNKVSDLIITNAGKLYDSSTPPTIVISAPTGDSNKQATLSLQYDSINDKVSDLIITNAGKLYDSSTPPTITISAFDSIGGSTATAIATVVNNRLSSILITDSGSGYTSEPTVSISTPTLSLSNFIATATVGTENNRLNSLSILDSGDFYITAPQVTVSAPTLSLSDFTATASSIIVNNKLNSVSILDSGDFYITAPQVTVSAPTKSANDFIATGSVVMNQPDNGNSLLSITMTSSGRFYTSIPTVTIDSATGDSAHFRATGFANLDNINRKITSIGIVNSGKYYDSNVTPIVTIAEPPLANWDVGEKITHKLPTTTLHGEVSAYDGVVGKLSLVHVGAADGEYHNFIPSTDSDIVGATGGSKAGIVYAVEVNKISSNEQNEEFDANVSGSALDFLDFSETNPFGDPGDV